MRCINGYDLPVEKISSAWEARSYRRERAALIDSNALALILMKSNDEAHYFDSGLL
jgi:hypothetical protein